MPTLNSIHAKWDQVVTPDTVLPTPCIAEWRQIDTGLQYIVDACLVATVELEEDGSPGAVLILPNGSNEPGYGTCRKSDTHVVLEPLHAEYFLTESDAVHAVERYLGVSAAPRDPESDAVPWDQYLERASSYI